MIRGRENRLLFGGIPRDKKLFRNAKNCLTRMRFCAKIPFVGKQDLFMEKSPSLVEGARLEIV